MDVVEEHRRYGDSTMLEPIIEQQDDEVRNLYKKTKIKNSRFPLSNANNTGNVINEKIKMFFRCKYLFSTSLIADRESCFI